MPAARKNSPVKSRSRSPVKKTAGFKQNITGLLTKIKQNTAKVLKAETWASLKPLFAEGELLLEELEHADERHAVVAAAVASGRTVAKKFNVSRRQSWEW